MKVPFDGLGLVTSAYGRRFHSRTRVSYGVQRCTIVRLFTIYLPGRVKGTVFFSNYYQGFLCALTRGIQRYVGGPITIFVSGVGNYAFSCFKGVG